MRNPKLAHILVTQLNLIRRQRVMSVALHGYIQI